MLKKENKNNPSREILQNNPEVGSSALKLHSTRCVALVFFPGQNKFQM